MRFFSQIFLVACALFIATPVFAAPIVPGSFSTTWDTGVTNSVETDLGTCASSVYWEEIGNPSNNGTSTSCVAGTHTTTVASPGDYRVDYSGNFTTIDLYANRNKFRTVEQWGTSIWTDLEGAFQYVDDVSIPATDAPNLTSVTSLEAMFHGATNFNSDIEHWNVSNVTNMRELFGWPGESSAFNQPLNNWDVSNVTDMEWMFFGTPFNQPLNNWDVSSVTNMNYTFNSMPNFNQPLNNWDMASVTTMVSMFGGSQNFNQPLNNWDVSNVSIMSDVFFLARAFNQPLDSWDVSNVTTMNRMFGDASAFNQPLNNWDVSNVTDMNSMFESSAFNQPINNWDVSNVISMAYMFNGATAFNQRLDIWDVSNVTTMEDMLTGTVLSEAKYTWLLTSWSALSVQPDVYFGVSAEYCGATAQAARDILTNVPNNWIITDGGAAADCIIEVDEVESSGGSSGTRIGDRVRSYFFSSTTSSTPPLVTTESFLEGVRNLIEYLTKNEDDLASLSAAESTKIIIGLRDIILFLLSLLPTYE